MPGSPINWGPVPAGDPVLEHPLYLKWSNKTLNQIMADYTSLKTDLGDARCDNDTAGVVAYLSWLVRVVILLA